MTDNESFRSRSVGAKTAEDAVHPNITTSLGSVGSRNAGVIATEDAATPRITITLGSVYSRSETQNNAFYQTCNAELRLSNVALANVDLSNVGLSNVAIVQHSACPLLTWPMYACPM